MSLISLSESPVVSPAASTEQKYTPLSHHITSLITKSASETHTGRGKHSVLTTAFQRKRQNYTWTNGDGSTTFFISVPFPVLVDTNDSLFWMEIFRSRYSDPRIGSLDPLFWTTVRTFRWRSGQSLAGSCPNCNADWYAVKSDVKNALIQPNKLMWQWSRKYQWRWWCNLGTCPRVCSFRSPSKTKPLVLLTGHHRLAVPGNRLSHV